MTVSVPKILYVANNDGSDMRVSKEVNSLAKQSDVHFVGVGVISDNSFAIKACKHYSLVSGNVRNPIAIFFLILKILKLRVQNKYQSVHVVDEQFYALVWPALIGIHKVLDVFDSVFLRYNFPKNRLLVIKRLIYLSVDHIFVTDKDRWSLLPEFAKPFSSILPNVPDGKLEDYADKKFSDNVVLAHFGTLAKNRGSLFVHQLASSFPEIKVFCAGWIVDEFTEELMLLDNVEYLGVMPQGEANEFVFENVDYVIAIYPEGNLNNFYASPNKIYDSIYAQTPIIICDNVNVAEFVSEEGIGLVVDQSSTDYESLVRKLKECKGHFKFSEDLRKKSLWSCYEDVLFSAHRLLANRVV